MTDSEKAEQIVYISCLDEIRYSFVSHLSDALRRKGIVVFVDSDDLLSNEAQAMVKRARVSVMVLTGNLEPTTACLIKLVNVIRCQRNHDQVVVPVCYGIGTHERGWLDSLLKFSGSSQGHQSRKECSDSKLVKEIVRDVYEKLFYMERIGIYPKLLEIENIIRKQPLGIRCLGIWGMPGIGKTTLAKAVFDQMSCEYDAYCFIEDYDRVIREKGLYGLLEEQLLEEKSANGSTISKLSLLRGKLDNKRVLVVLDDVCNPLFAESFLGWFDWFGPESLIIITSRDKQVFCLCQVDQIYEVHGLNEKEALQLFFLSASIKDMAEQNLHELSMKVIKYANGNPLALNIYGRELKGKKKLSEMKTAFLKLKGSPPYKIVDAFKSSYDTLSDNEKNIFLDIACFFHGENVDYVMRLLEGCGFFPHVGIDVLSEKCLVTISENRVRMHNLTQYVGREIINGETVQIERRSRLWEPSSIKYLLEETEHKVNVEPKTIIQRAQGTEEIEGMFLDTSNLSFDAKPAAFQNMLNLRLLKIYCSDPEAHPVINFPKGIHSLPKELRLLHWEHYPLQSLPPSFDPMHLVEINMPYSQLQTLWDGTKNLETLRTIRLCHSQQLVDIGDLSKAENLEVVDLQGCPKLQSFPATGKLLHLRVVNLSGCIKIKSFLEVPPNIETLHLQGTRIIELPLTTVKPNYRELVNLLKEIPGLSGVSNLEHSDLERLKSLMTMGLSSTQDLGKLSCLELKNCSCLRILPNMVNLEFLRVLDLSGCSVLETVQGFPRNVKELYLAGTAVREVSQLPQSLELLNAHGCVSLKSLILDSKQLPMHYTFSNCFDLSPQAVNDFLVKVLVNVKHMPREHQQEPNRALAFSFCAPSHVNHNSNSTLDLQLGSSVMTQLNTSWRNTLVGFTMLVEVAFSEDYYNASGFSISCVCRWKNKAGQSHRIERDLHCWAPGEVVPKIQKNHMFVFCDVKMRPSTNEGNDPNIFADLVVFEFFTTNQQTKRQNDSCIVARCGVYLITSTSDNTKLEISSPDSSLAPTDYSGNEVEQVLRVSYDGLHEIDKALFLYIACLFNDDDVDLVAPLIARIDLDISSGLKALANSSVIHVSSNRQIVMHSWLRNMGKEILHKESIMEAEVSSPAAPAKPMFRHEYYQTPEKVVVTIFTNGILPKQNINVEFGVQILSVVINVASEEAYYLQLRLFKKIIPEKCRYEVLSTKVQIHLAKAEIITWASLDYGKEQAILPKPNVASAVSQKPVYPSSKPGKKFWDELEAEAKKQEKDEKLDGDAAMTKFIIDVYQNADEDLRRAKNKSFAESNRTVLSTNWKEVGAKKVESTPPAELIGGVALAELVRQLIKVSKKGYRCRDVAGNLAIMIGDILPTIREIQYSGVELSLQRQLQLRIFSETLEKCMKLAEKVLKCNRYDMVRQLYHSNKMEGLEKKISSFLRGPLLTHILVDIHHLRAASEVRFDQTDWNFDRLINEKLDSMKLRGGRFVREVEVVTDGDFEVGLDLGKKKVKEMMFGLKDEGGVIGISGMSGSGKTTLARHLERDKEVRVHFGNRVLFLTVSQSPNIEDMRASLWGFLTGGGFGATNHVSIGQTQKKLVILDDVWTRESLDQLMFKVPGTTTLVVSRSKLADSRDTYDVELLKQNEATSLFCLSAFDQKSVPSGFSLDLVKQVVQECKGLPLALKVVGASLKNQPDKYWEGVVKRLSRGEPANETHESRMFAQIEATLETLDLKTRECFLDMGAFPEDKKIPIGVIINRWVEMHDLEEETAFALLVDLSNKNLLTLVKDPRLGAQYTSYYDIFVTQHNILRDLALHLSNRGKVHRRERLFMPKKELVPPREWERYSDEPYNARVVSIHTEEMSAMEWFEMELPKAEVLILNFSAANYVLPPFIAKMGKLRALMIINNGMSFARLHDFSIFTNLAKLRSLWLERVHVPELSSSTVPFKNLHKMSLILCKIKNSFDQTSPDMSQLFPNMYDLTIDHCEDFVELSSTICGITSLKSLSITHCPRIKELPKNMIKLKALQLLRLYACPELKSLPVEICELPSLEYLDISQCVSLSSVPGQIGKLRKLEKIDMRECSVSSIPSSAVSLTSLRHVICDVEALWMWEEVEKAVPGLRVEAAEKGSSLY